MGNKSVSLPTGNDFLAGLNDGREIWAYGEKVDNVITHPAFRNSALSIAKLYDALHDEKYQAILTTPCDTGSGGVTHPFFRVPHSVDDLIRDRDAIAQWARLSYGWLGRSPDFKASFLTTLGANPEAYGESPDTGTNARKRSYFTGIMPSLTRLSTAISRPTRLKISAFMSKKSVMMA